MREKGIPFICENPRRSLMWMTDPFLHLPDTFHFQHVHSCMYGGKRKKRTSFLMNFYAANLLLDVMKATHIYLGEWWHRRLDLR